MSKFNNTVSGAGVNSVLVALEWSGRTRAGPTTDLQGRRRAVESLAELLELLEPI